MDDHGLALRQDKRGVADTQYGGRGRKWGKKQEKPGNQGGMERGGKGGKKGKRGGAEGSGERGGKAHRPDTEKEEKAAPEANGGATRTPSAGEKTDTEAKRGGKRDDTPPLGSGRRGKSGFGRAGA